MSIDQKPKKPRRKSKRAHSKVVEPKKMGRPPKLAADDKTIGIIRGLAAIQCTQKMAAGVLGVSENTFNDFLRSPANKKVLEVWETGRESGKVSILQMQFARANKSTAMLIWLGKQYLGQTEKIEEKIDVTAENRVVLTSGAPDFHKIDNRVEAVRQFMQFRQQLAHRYVPPNKVIDVTPQLLNGASKTP